MDEKVRSNSYRMPEPIAGVELLRDMGSRVSVIIPVYNGEDFVTSAVDSVLAQTYENVELIVVNDGSVDGTFLLLEQYTDRIRVITTENGGLSVARNVGILAATGEYIAFLDADDLWHPRKLELQMEALEANPDWVMLCNRRIKFRDGEVVQMEGVEKLELEQLPGTYDILHRNPVHASSVLMRKQVLAQAGLFVPKLGGAAEDTEMWVRISKLGAIAVCDPHMTYMRDHADNTTKTYEYRKRRLATLHYMRQRWSHDGRAVQIVTRNISDSVVAFAYEASDRGEYRLARKYFCKAFFLNPVRIKWLLKMLSYVGR